MFNRLTEILGDRDLIKRVFACIQLDKVYSKIDAAKHAFMHFGTGGQRHGSDLDDQQARHMVSEFSRYRTQGTNSRWGKLITRIVDSVHFCRSHRSRMIQLADLYVFTVSHDYSRREGWFADADRKAVAGANLWPDGYKEWPK